MIELGRASAGIRKWKKWISDETDQDRSWDHDSGYFHCIIDVGIRANASRDARPTDPALRIAAADPRGVSIQPHSVL